MPIVVASPPPSAVGGVSRHTEALLHELPHAKLFDEWWPCATRPSSPVARTFLHGVTLLRFVAKSLASARSTNSIHLQATDGGVARDAALAVVARMLGIPVVTHLHGSGFQRMFTGAGPSRQASLLLRLSTRVVVMSEMARSAVATAAPGIHGRVVVVPNPVPRMGGGAPPRDSVTTPPLRLLCVGEIGLRKGQRELAQVVNHMADDGHRIQLTLVGPWGDLKQPDGDIQHSPHVCYLGTLRGPALTRAYQEADVFVLFSNAEAEPLSILEAMSFGLPIIATDTGSVAELLSTVPGNQLVVPKDLTQLSTAILSWCSQPSLRADVGAANAQYVRNHRSVAAHADRLLEIHSALRRR